MTEDKLRELYLKQIEDYCNVIFDELPPGAELALEELIKVDPMRYNVTSKKLSDMSMTYADNNGDIPKYIKTWLSPYRRIFLTGNKEKRPYSGSRRYKQG